MKKEKTFMIEGYKPEITVNELTVGQIIGLIDDSLLDDLSVESFKKILKSDCSLNFIY